MQGGTCEGFYSRYSASQSPALERQNAYTRLTYDLTDSTNVYAEALYAHSTASIIATPNYDLFGVTIQRTNVICRIHSARMDTGITSFSLGRWLPVAPTEVFPTPE
jgi:hypothetical protein